MTRYNFVSELRVISSPCIFRDVCPKKFCDDRNLDIERICLSLGEGIYFELHSQVQGLEDYTQNNIQELEDYIEELNSEE
ncbi:MAG: hypothetical protein WC391_08775 [Methanoregula sp.]|jgi:hypothetical protein